MKVYEALHCPCVYESAFATISLHETRDGAEKAVELHKQKRIEMYGSIEFEAYDVSETEVLK